MTPEEAEDPKDHRERHKTTQCGFGKKKISCRAKLGNCGIHPCRSGKIAHKKTTTEELRNLITKGSKY